MEKTIENVFKPVHVDGDVICIDMDGVLAEWSTGGAPDKVYTGFFEMRPPVWRAIVLALLLNIKYHVVILSSVYEHGTAVQEKLIWLDKIGLKRIDRVFVPYGAHKTDYISCTGKRFLIDDYSVNLHKWAEEGGIGIKFMNQFNGNHGTWQGDRLDEDLEPEEMFEMVCKIVETHTQTPAHARPSNTSYYSHA